MQFVRSINATPILMLFTSSTGISALSLHALIHGRSGHSLHGVISGTIMGVPIPYSTSESIPLMEKWGQTFMHSLHLVQRDRNNDSSTAPGGLIYFLFRTGLFSVSTENSTIFLVISAKAVLKNPRLSIIFSSEESFIRKSFCYTSSESFSIAYTVSYRNTT